MWLGKIKGKDSRNRREMNEPNCIGTWLLFCDKKVFVDFFTGEQHDSLYYKGVTLTPGVLNLKKDPSAKCVTVLQLSLTRKVHGID